LAACSAAATRAATSALLCWSSHLLYCWGAMPDSSAGLLIEGGSLQEQIGARHIRQHPRTFRR
jgi:hypothetical protein